MKKGFVKLFIVLICIFAVAFTVSAQKAAKKVEKNALTFNKLALMRTGDVAIVGVTTGPCMCSADLKRYHNAISPKNMSAFIFNKSKFEVKVRVTFKYFSLSRDPGKWKEFTRDLTIPANSTSMCVVWANNYYDIIRIKGAAQKLFIDVKITSKNVREFNLSDNKWIATDCEYYVM
ncbi:MAG: hypothetical protein ABFR75_02260 [Acidobacteriota bacterium]